MPDQPHQSGLPDPAEQPVRDWSDLSHANPAQMTRVWPRAGPSAAGGLWLPDELGDILRHQLVVPIEGWTTPDPGGAPFTYGDLLLRHPSPPVDVLRRVADGAKPDMQCDDGGLPREVAGVLYFAAILAARVRLGQRISGLDDGRLREAALWAMRLPWLNDPMAGLFREGLVVLKTSDATAQTAGGTG